MKNLHLLWVLVIILFFISCEKDPPLPLTTVVEGSFIDQRTQLPIENAMFLIRDEIDNDSWWTTEYDVYEIVTDENGEFSFTLTSADSYKNTIHMTGFYSYSEFWSAYQRDSVLVNGRLDSEGEYYCSGFDGDFFGFEGLCLKKGNDYFMELELFPK